MKKERMNNKGFSLVELIIVIAIMAVLVVVLAPQFLKYVEKGRVSTDKDNAAAIATALQVWAAAEGSPAHDIKITVSPKNATNPGIAFTTDPDTWASDALTDAGIKAGDAPVQSKEAAWKDSYTVEYKKDSTSGIWGVVFVPAAIGEAD